MFGLGGVSSFGTSRLWWRSLKRTQEGREDVTRRSEMRTTPVVSHCPMVETSVLRRKSDIEGVTIDTLESIQGMKE